MTEHSARDMIYHDPLDGFTDREAILALFEQLLRSAQPGQLRVLAIKGNSGTGKTFLTEYLCERVCLPAGWVTSQLRFFQSQPDFRTILTGLEDALKGCVARADIDQYRKKRDEYARHFDEYISSITIHQTIGVREQSSLAGVEMHVGIIADLHKRELHLRTLWSRALLELAEGSEHPLCIFIDGYERLVGSDPTGSLVGWLWEDLLLRLAQSISSPLLIVTSGWEWPNNAAISPFVQAVELDDFGRVQVRSYLHKQQAISLDQPGTEQDDLVEAFYVLTRGHPLVLSLAVTYFHELPARERTAISLRIERLLLDEKARVAFLQERLMSRLPEPYRTILKWGPVLRAFDQSALQALLYSETGPAADGIIRLDDQAYNRFLLYPFIRQTGATRSDSLPVQGTFHELVRWLGLSGLRNHHPQTKIQLHQKMVDYYEKIVLAGEEKGAERIMSPSGIHYAVWKTPMPEQIFRALVEMLYHALQVPTLQIAAFSLWEQWTGRMVDRWSRQRAGLLLAVIRQLVEEGESFLARMGDPYGQYLFWQARFLEQEACYEEAQKALEEAEKIFEHLGKQADRAASLHNIALLHYSMGDLQQALQYHERALQLKEQLEDPADVAVSLNNIGAVYVAQGELRLALRYYERALAIRKRGGDPKAHAATLHNMAIVYGQVGETAQALALYEQALILCQTAGAQDEIALILNGIGGIYSGQGKKDEALSYYRQALNICEQGGNSGYIATCIDNIGTIHASRGDLVDALKYHERALALYQGIGSPSNIAICLSNIASVFYLQGNVEQALEYQKQALSLSQEINDTLHTARFMLGLGSFYYVQEKFGQSLGYHMGALVILNKLEESDLLRNSFNTIIAFYQQQETIEKAIEQYDRAFKNHEHEGYCFEPEVADGLELLGLCHAQTGEFKKSLTCYTYATRFREALLKN
jgi:tetratricopeptide (TPR) repeat protein